MSDVLAGVGIALAVAETSLTATWFFASGSDRTPAGVLYGTTVALLWVWLAFFVIAASKEKS